MSATGPSPHLSWRELACRDGTPYPREWRQSRAVPLARAFETIRHACGDRPIRVLSAYRTEAHNRRVGGARNSQHVHGRALDLRPPDGFTVEGFYRICRGVAKDAGIRGLGIYPTFIHIDIRESDRLIVWQGNRAWAEVL